MVIKYISMFIQNLFYPPVCGFCAKLDKDFLCPRCRLKLKNLAKVKKEKFGYTTSYFENLIYCFKYEGNIRANLIKYKFNENTSFYKSFVNFCIKNKKIFKILKSYDTIIPVPISKTRKMKRGYNQTVLIAKYLAEKLQVDYDDTILIKVKDNREQSALNKEQRIENIKNVYQVSKNTDIIDKKFKGKKILLIDDIYTTGSTCKECCRVLHELDVEKIDIFVVAKD